MTVNSVVDAPPGSRPALEHELLRERAGLLARLDAIARSRARQDEIADRSYWHPNGFIKLVLEERPGGGQLRLHVWPQVGDEDDIHSHGWSYASVVIGGTVGDLSYAETSTDEGVPMWRHAYGQTAHRRFALADPVPVRIVPTADNREWTTGDRSGGTPAYTHRFFAVRAPAVTMLRVGPAVEPYSYVYRSDPVPRQAVVPRATTRADVVEWLGLVAEMAAAGEG